MTIRREAFSLLELVLAIGLSIALATLLGFAINLHVVRLDSSRTTIEQAQVARAILDRIAADLRAVTTVPTQDVSELLAAAEATASFDVDQIDQAADSETTEAAVSESSEAPAGLYGTIDTLQLDRRRVRQSLMTIEIGSTPSARIDAAWDRVEYRLSANADTPGLVRTETPRDTARWRAEQGEAAVFAEPLAPEVQAISFGYYDADQRLEAWDMAEQEALPQAVEVIIKLAPADAIDDMSAPGVRRKPRAYRRLVRLPESHEKSSNEDAGDAEATDEGTL